MERHRVKLTALLPALGKSRSLEAAVWRDRTIEELTALLWEGAGACGAGTASIIGVPARSIDRRLHIQPSSFRQVSSSFVECSVVRVK